MIERRSLAVQIADRIGEEIGTGTWTADLPGKRTLAERYGVNAKTCAEALCLLERRDMGRLVPAVCRAHSGSLRGLLAKGLRPRAPDRSGGVRRRFIALTL